MSSSKYISARNYMSCVDIAGMYVDSGMGKSFECTARASDPGSERVATQAACCS